jgi:predicted transcriptional regulator
VTDAELAVLKVLWAEGPSAIRALADRLYPGGGPSHYATVQKLLERLESKGHVTRRAGGRANLYEAAVERRDLIARRLQETADRLCDGSLAPLLSHLVGAADLSPEELRALRAMLDGAEGTQRKE